MRLYDKVPSREVRHLWQFNAKLAEECRLLRLKIAERTEERDELITGIFKMYKLINRCYCHLDSMSNIAMGVDTLYKKRKTRHDVVDVDEEEGDGGDEEEEDVRSEASCSCDGGHSDASSD